MFEMYCLLHKKYDMSMENKIYKKKVISGEHPTGMSYLFYYTEQNVKHKKGETYKQRFWINKV